MNQQEASKIDLFLGTLQHLSEHTRKSYQRDLKVLLEFVNVQEVHQWNELDGRQIRSFVAWRHRQGIGGRSLQRNLSATRAFYRYLIGEGVAQHNPAEGVQAPKSPKILPKLLDVDQVAQLLEIDDKDPLAIRDKAILELMYSSGLRLSELVMLNIDSLDLADAVAEQVPRHRDGFREAVDGIVDDDPHQRLRQPQITRRIDDPGGSERSINEVHPVEPAFSDASVDGDLVVPVEERHRAAFDFLLFGH